MRMLMSIVLCALMLGTAAVAQAPETAKDTDPWIGKKRGEVVAMLGRPDKVKSSGSKETLTYRFVRVTDEPAVPPGIELVPVPGVEGSVGRMYRRDSTAISMTGTQVDARGRVAEEGIGGEESRNISWSKKDGKTITDSADDRSAVLGKCTVKFKLTNGRVTDWSVSSN